MSLASIIHISHDLFFILFVTICSNQHSQIVPRDTILFYGLRGCDLYLRIARHGLKSQPIGIWAFIGDRDSLPLNRSC